MAIENNGFVGVEIVAGDSKFWNNVPNNHHSESSDVL